MQNHTGSFLEQLSIESWFKKYMKLLDVLLFVPVKKL